MSFMGIANIVWVIIPKTCNESKLHFLYLYKYITKRVHLNVGLSVVFLALPCAVGISS